MHLIKASLLFAIASCQTNKQAAETCLAEILDSLEDCKLTELVFQDKVSKKCNENAVRKSAWGKCFQDKVCEGKMKRAKKQKQACIFDMELPWEKSKPEQCLDALAESLDDCRITESEVTDVIMKKCSETKVKPNDWSVCFEKGDCNDEAKLVMHKLKKCDFDIGLPFGKPEPAPKPADPTKPPKPMKTEAEQCLDVIEASLNDCKITEAEIKNKILVTCAESRVSTKDWEICFGKGACDDEIKRVKNQIQKCGLSAQLPFEQEQPDAPKPAPKPAATVKPAPPKPAATEKPAPPKPAATEKPAPPKPAAIVKPAPAEPALAQLGNMLAI